MCCGAAGARLPIALILPRRAPHPFAPPTGQARMRRQPRNQASWPIVLTNELENSANVSNDPIRRIATERGLTSADRVRADVNKLGEGHKWRQTIVRW